MENRRFHRVKFSAQSELTHQGLSYRGRLENLSLRGALISAGECIMVPNGDFCTLAIILEDDPEPMVMRVEVMHSFFSMVGVCFRAFEGNAEERLHRLMELITAEPDRLRQELQYLSAVHGEG